MTAYEFIQLHNISVCDAATEALEAFDGGIEEYFDTHQRGYFAFLWCIKYAKEAIAPLITPERVDRSAKNKPDIALMYAVPHLTPDRLDWCAERFYVLALRHADNYLTQERRAWCKSQIEESFKARWI